MRFQQPLRASGLVLFAGLTVFMTSSGWAWPRKPKSPAAAPVPAEKITKVVGQVPESRIVVPEAKGASSQMTGANFEAVGKRAVRVRASAELADSGLDQRYIWSFGVYASDDRRKVNPLFQVHDTDHPFAVEPSGKLSPTFDHLFQIPLPAGEYYLEIGILELPPQVHRGGLAKIPNLQDFRGVRSAKVVRVTD